MCNSSTYDFEYNKASKFDEYLDTKSCSCKYVSSVTKY